jgi:hypothetical protein
MHSLSRRLSVCVFVLAALLLVVMGGCGRSSLEAETLEDAGAPQTCGPSTCPNGCCDAKGVCRTGTDVRACGSVGGRCSDCVATGFAVCTGKRVCGRDDPNCSAASCANGCCATDDGKRRCLAGSEPGGCGDGGAECRDCGAEGRACDATTRACGSSSCTSANCDGCCVGDKCLEGDIASACGTKGGACTTCAAGQTCVAQSSGGGSCTGPTTCDPTSCASGCCDATGRCVAGNDTTACGKGGVRCAACTIDQVCSPGVQTCQPRVPCGPSNCDGCCGPNNQCVTASTTTAQACGARGEACRQCGQNLVCDRPTGTCKPPTSACNPLNCPTCCAGDRCVSPDQDLTCGLGGGSCVDCTRQGLLCAGGSCQARRCTAATCPNGCCSGNTCVLGGSANNACGPNGGVCTNCEQNGQVCQNRQCTTACTPDNCPGCCRSATVCDPRGTSNQSCGSGGAACANCTLSGSFCNGFVTPRRCNNQQSTCPAPYPSCPAGTTTPVTPSLQNLCSDAALAAIGTACSTSPSSRTCVDALAAAGTACSSCLRPFLVPFQDLSGLYACVAPNLDAACRRATGCAIDCASTSCGQCSSATEDQCVDFVNLTQCVTFSAAGAACALRPLAPGQPCSPISYPDYGQWLRSVGDHFCGNGP